MPDNFDVKVYDSTQIRIQFAGQPISKGAGASGYGEDTFLTIKQPTDSFTEVEGTDGTITRSKTNTRKFEAEITLMQTSASNDLLSGMCVSDEQAQNGQGIASFNVEDLNGTTLFISLKAWVVKPADMEFAKGAKERKWTIKGSRSQVNVGSN